MLQLPARRVRPDDTESGMLYLFAPTVSEQSLVRSPAIVSGRYLVPQDENALVVPTSFLIDEPDLRLGGDVVMKIYGKERTFKIVGTFVGTSYLHRCSSSTMHTCPVSPTVWARPIPCLRSPTRMT